ncbi:MULTISPECIES: acyl-homoserine-lactone synthase [unclassified Burkholderia]|uniref:acyl-homoserine-lactone synthase n=1 Tax=unclassified Burkholderia TaxID=2613784 RepID=UPI000F57A62B|nr:MULTISPECIES: acyl-homoserine-lactone synthase [unclassified Burkholderia]RQR30937.1 GNAT family N-acetyltransferase [Burkholderia sp. Bp9131]RQR63298.1 GNAT family N-acetyltransferase [Burkholderia sp. Bp9015]RQR82360.1 GNAT family N-acetyltransferase [Burkholderia sp. Bp9011]RQR92161.1 GNAT family N-acetyltransferase [Burkholderia sp. Bp9010]RQS76326.1 GNAT family N-acetyltransferase [Burkholderia sp. Bp8977]
MLTLLSGNSADLSHETMYRLAKFRHKVFIQELGWSLPTDDGIEFDDFDHAAPLYVVAFDRSGEIVGCGRLLPTDEPYLLGEVFPDLMGGASLPSTRNVWELSRFAMSMRSGESLTAEESWQNTRSLMSEIVRVAHAHGADRLIAFSVLGNERLLKRMGVNVHRAAPPQMIEGKPTLPFWIEIDQQTRAALNLDALEYGVPLNMSRSAHVSHAF